MKTRWNSIFHMLQHLGKKKTFPFCNVIGSQRINANTITADTHEKCVHYHSAIPLSKLLKQQSGKHQLEKNEWHMCCVSG